MTIRTGMFLAAAMVLGACGPQLPPGERAAKACDEQFGKGSPSSADCQVKIALKSEARIYGERQREAERRAGQ